MTPNELGQLGALLRVDNGQIRAQNLDDHTVSDQSGIVYRDEFMARMHRLERMFYAMQNGNGMSRDEVGALMSDADAPVLQTSTLGHLFDKYAHQPDLRHVLIGETVDEATNQVMPLLLNIPDSVHVLLTGASGLGKSTLIEAIALQLAGLQDVRLAAIDYGSGTFDGVESWLSWELAETPKMAIALMIEIISLIERRKEMYKEFERVRSIDQYNTMAIRANREPLPFVVVMIDETSPLLEEDGTKKPIVELARTGRKFGVGLIFGGTDFKADNLPTEARGNCQARMSFWLEAGLSRSLFNNTKANELDGKGDILVRRSGHTGLVRGRTPIVVDADYARLGNDVASQQKLVPVCDPNPTVDVDDNTIANALCELARSDRRFSRSTIERDLFGYTGGRAHKEVKRVAEKMHIEIETILEGKNESV